MPQFLSASLRLCAILLVAPAALADEPLTWKWAVGDAPRYEMTQTTRMSVEGGAAGQTASSMSQGTVMQWKVQSVEPGGDATLEVQTQRVVMRNEGQGGQAFEYDSDSEDPPAGMGALVAPMFEAIVEHPFQLTMRPTGEITGTALSDDLKRAFDRLPGGAVSGEMASQINEQLIVEFPEEPLAVGDQWTNTTEVAMPAVGSMKVLTTYTYNGAREVDGHEYEAFTPSMQVEVDPGDRPLDMQFESKESTGEVLFDREAGRLFRSRMLQKMEVLVKFGDQEVVNVVDQVFEMRQLAEDEAPSLGGLEADEAQAEEPAATE